MKIHTRQVKDRDGKPFYFAAQKASDLDRLEELFRVMATRYGCNLRDLELRGVAVVRKHS